MNTRPLFASLVTLASMTLAGNALALTLAYENNDSKDYAVPAVCSGSTQDPVKFSKNTTSSVSIQGSGTCKLTLNGTTYEFSKDARILIKDGKITLK